MTNIGVFAVLFWLFFLAIMAINILGLIFWIYMLVDVIQRKNWEDENQKILWVLVVVLAGWIGAIIYYFVVKRPSDQKSTAEIPPSSQ